MEYFCSMVCFLVFVAFRDRLNVIVALPSWLCFSSCGLKERGLGLRNRVTSFFKKIHFKGSFLMSRILPWFSYVLVAPTRKTVKRKPLTVWSSAVFAAASLVKPRFPHFSPHQLQKLALQAAQAGLFLAYDVGATNKK